MRTLTIQVQDDRCSNVFIGDNLIAAGLSKDEALWCVVGFLRGDDCPPYVKTLEKDAEWEVKRGRTPTKREPCPLCTCPLCIEK